MFQNNLIFKNINKMFFISCVYHAVPYKIGLDNIIQRGIV